MTTIDALLIGMLSTLVGIAIFLAGKRVWGLLSVLPSLRDNVGKLYGSVLDLTAAAKLIVNELAYMRSLTTAGQTQAPGQSPMAGTASAEPLPPFPSTDYSRFRTAPDAEIEDTDDVSLQQTDADMEQMEVIENLRRQGITIDEPDVEHPGVTVESE